jgi:hypothetical protein
MLDADIDFKESMMTERYTTIGALVLTAMLLWGGAARAEVAPAPAPQRVLVNFPPSVRDHFLENMRDHLAAVSEIQVALSEGKFDQAAETAKQRLGMAAPSAMACQPGMAHMSGMAQFMPSAMRNAGRAMHDAADRFAADAASHDDRAAIAALSRITQACVACHAKYKVR